MSLLAALLVLGVAADCPGTTTREVEACASEGFRRADEALNRYHKAATDRLARDQPAALPDLRRSETAWIAHRDAECGAVHRFWSEGSIAATAAATCKTRMTRARTLAIWTNWLTYIDSTPPLLPRPEG